ncbi:Fe-S cluster assembly protein SufD [Henriciella barbarensis]|uniref:Fe-S cluster assembly protein SufD n=1 Tax=Henriciella barbarensis TaxID=86342 RepID=A0A399R6Q3_9PROT|nr:Fe-S cluster assembly protein SufD [Henriciella barbarensis]RIJ26181.1 Fe-S cluster assembly protein SufD [Henriciella barbarensis]
MTTTALKNPSEAERQLTDLFSQQKPEASQKAAFEAFTRSGLPHRRMEQWKWTDVRQAVSRLATVDTAADTSIELPSDAIELRFDGSAWTIPDKLSEGLKIFAKSGGHDFAQADALPLGALASSMTGHSGEDMLMIEVSAKVDQPLVLTYHGGGAAAFSRVVFVVRKDCHLDLFEHYSGGAGFSAFLAEFGLAENASVDRTVLQESSREEVTAITTTAHLDAKATFKQTALSFGGKLCRMETRLEHQGEGAEATLNGAYLVASGFHTDFTTHVTHGAESCVTSQLTKGAVADGGRGVFQGKFLVPRTVGQFTDAEMQHQALLLENGAEIFAKPELEIYADDVECEHGNTSGQLDDDALFYMQQRGIPKPEARALLTEAFIAEALGDALKGVRDQLIEATRRFLRNQGSN